MHHYIINPPKIHFKSSTKVNYYRYPDRWNHGPNDWYGLKEPLDASLFNAVIENNLDLTRQLITQGANVNARVDGEFPGHGDNPLKIAIANNSLTMAKLLMSAGAEVNTTIDTGGIADEIGKHAANDARNNTLLAYAIILNRPGMVKLLLELGADVNKPDPAFKRWTPLMIAHYNNRDEIAKILINACAKK